MRDGGSGPMEQLLDGFQDDVHDQTQPSDWSNGDADAALPAGSGDYLVNKGRQGGVGA